MLTGGMSTRDVCFVFSVSHPLRVVISKRIVPPLPSTSTHASNVLVRFRRFPAPTLPEFLLIVWGVLFVTAQTEEPRLKGRNLKKTVQRGLDGVVKGAQTVASIRIIGGKKRAPSTFVDMEARPHWQSGGNVTVAAVSPPVSLVGSNVVERVETKAIRERIPRGSSLDVQCLESEIGFVLGRLSPRSMSCSVSRASRSEGKSR